MKTNYVLPSEIEKHSFEIIRAELKERGLSLDPNLAPVIWGYAVHPATYSSLPAD